MVMMGSAFAKNNRREIRRTIGRYMAILAIIALGVGFFAGIRVTRTAMVKTGDEYLDRTNMFDFRLISTLGITDEDVEYFRGLDGVTGAEGSVSRDFLALDESGREYVLKALMLGNINMPSLVSGRMPDSPGSALPTDGLFPQRI